VTLDTQSQGNDDGASVESSFASLGLDHWQLETLSGLSIRRPTAVQAACIPAILHGEDVAASAKTGAGKTAAFALPILKSLSQDPHGFHALVLTPTRELALQIVEQFRVLGRSIKAGVCAVMGGMDMMKQAAELSRGPHIVVATPGRLADLLESCPDVVSLRRLRYLVLDEADRLVGPGSTFKDGELPRIIAQVNPAAQRLLFSATMSPEVEAYAASTQRGLFVYRATEEFGTVSRIKQRALLIPSQIRDAYLAHLVGQTFAGQSMIIFVGKCKTCELVLRMLRELGHRVVALHSRMTQSDRIAALARFKGGQVPVLVSTDVGSRGLDIPAVQVVLNMDVPADARDYVHRIGRTARAGRSGLALTFIHELDIDLIANIEACTGVKMEALEEAPAEKDVLLDLNKVIAAKRAASMALHDTKFGHRAETNRRKWKKKV
jgi:ATP-dependent RNA helicase DDX49/DBP8